MRLEIGDLIERKLEDIKGNLSSECDCSGDESKIVVIVDYCQGLT
jgi:hypothetical protein